jgi:hypothetical protein
LRRSSRNWRLGAMVRVEIWPLFYQQSTINFLH